MIRQVALIEAAKGDAAQLELALRDAVPKLPGLRRWQLGRHLPGTVGGAVWANAGAHDADIAGVLESARVLAADGSEAIVPAARVEPPPR